MISGGKKWKKYILEFITDIENVDLESRNLILFFRAPKRTLAIIFKLKNQYLIGPRTQNQILLIMILRKFLLKYQEMNYLKKSLKEPTQCLFKNVSMKLKNLTQ